MPAFNWPWTAAITNLQAALAAVRTRANDQGARLIFLEHTVMTQQASLEALTTKVTALTNAYATVAADIGNAVAELEALKAQIGALPVGTAIDDSAVLDNLAAQIDSVVNGLTGSATTIETAVATAKA